MREVHAKPSDGKLDFLPQNMRVEIPDVCSMFQEGLSGLHVLEIIGDDGGFKLFCENAQSNVYAAYLLFQVVPFPSNAVSSAARFRME